MFIVVPRATSEAAFYIVSGLDKYRAETMPDLTQVFNRIDNVRDKPIVVAYSGGKDSTTVLDIFGRYAEERGFKAPVYIVYNETWLDPPPIRNWIYSHLKVVEEWTKKTGYPFHVIITTPPPGKDFFTLVLERGYALPAVRRHAPWCNKEMKTRPTAKLIRKLLKEQGYNIVVYVTGARAKESVRRRRSLEKLGVTSPLRKVKMEYLGETYYLAPIYDWSDTDVLNYLKENNPSVFGDRYEPLLELYRRYGENGTKLRTGCWICPQVSRDYFLEAYAKDHPEYQVVLEARRKIIEISENPEYRTAVSKNGHPAGRITIEGRKKIAHILYNLLQTPVGKELMRDYINNVPTLLKVIKKLIGQSSLNATEQE